MAKARGDSAARVYQTLPLAAPTGGLDLRTSLTQMGDDRARFLLNASLSEPGVFLSRAGYRVLTSDTGGILPVQRIQGALRAYFRTSTPSQVSTCLVSGFCLASASQPRIGFIAFSSLYNHVQIVLSVRRAVAL